MPKANGIGPDLNNLTRVKGDDKMLNGTTEAVLLNVNHADTISWRSDSEQGNSE
jgi:hypothetical protein